eukprot:5980116-Pleurochrysis_carterae.AAC.1
MGEESVQQLHQIVLAVAASPRQNQHFFAARAENGVPKGSQHGLAHDGIGKDFAHILVETFNQTLLSRMPWDHPLA